MSSREKTGDIKNNSCGFNYNAYAKDVQTDFCKHKCVILVLFLSLLALTPYFTLALGGCLLADYLNERNPKEISFVGEFADIRLNMSDTYFEVRSNETEIMGMGLKIVSVDQVDWYSLPDGKSQRGQAHLEGNHLEFRPLTSEVVLLICENNASIMTISPSQSANKYDVAFEIESPSNRTRIKLENTSRNVGDYVGTFHIELVNATGNVTNGERIDIAGQRWLSGRSEARVFFTLESENLYFTMKDASISKDTSQRYSDIDANRKTNITSIHANVSRGVLSIGKDYKPLPAAYGIKIQALKSGDLDYRLLPSNEIQIYGTANSVIVGGDELIPSNLDKGVQFFLVDNIGGIFALIGIFLGVLLTEYLRQRHKKDKEL